MLSIKTTPYKTIKKCNNFLLLMRIRIRGKGSFQNIHSFKFFYFGILTMLPSLNLLQHFQVNVNAAAHFSYAIRVFKPS